MLCSQGRSFGDLLAESGGEPNDGGGGLGQALGVGGIVFCRLMDERAAGAAGGDIGQRVRAVGRIDEVAQQHDVVAHAVPA